MAASCKGIYLGVFVAFIALVFQGFECGRILENDGDNYERFQKIPPAQVTAEKLYKFFLGGVDGKIVKRQARKFIDITFVIDSSSSISSYEFKKGNRALQLLSSRFFPDTHYAIVTIATRAKIHSKFTSREDAGRMLRNLRRSGGKTNTQEALALCQDLYRGSNNSGVRSGSLRRILVVTDGQSNIKPDLTVPNAVRLRLKGIEVFVMAVGEYLDGIKEMVRIASSTDAHMYRVADMNGLIDVVKLVPSRQDRPWFTHIFGG